MTNKLYKNKNWLYENFIVKSRTSYDIANELYTTQPVIHYWITKFNLNRNRKSPSNETKEQIRQTLKRKYKLRLLSKCLSDPIPKSTRIKALNSIIKPEYSTHINQGYKFIKINNKYLPESHYIWKKESEWGFIPKGFVVHHRNQDKLDNRIENLICIPLETHVSIHKGGV